MLMIAFMQQQKKNKKLLLTLLNQIQIFFRLHYSVDENLQT